MDVDIDTDSEWEYTVGFHLWAKSNNLSKTTL